MADYPPDPQMPPGSENPADATRPGDPTGGRESPDPAKPIAPTQDEINLALLSHLLGIFTSVLGPLVIWLIKKDESRFVDEHGKEALNFQIFVLIVYVAVMIFGCVTLGFGAALFPIVMIVMLIFGILATVEASKGRTYRYPLTLRLIK